MSVEEARAVLSKEPDYDIRWSVIAYDDVIMFCRGDHEKAEKCDWEKLEP